ncbi:MAG: GDP-mannose 4,6-dehydratase, partial [Candidatus Omnitrophica bacterium]|nr:GDP-mannose 4,6-dehydratase [Candidatus Omnitrophota bacterium]
YRPRMRMNDGRVVPNFIYQALNDKPITVYGTGKQTRSFCYVDDLVEGIFRLMIAKKGTPGINTPVNLGNPSEFSILEFARLVIKLTGTKSKLVFKPLPQDDPRQRKPDITKAKKLLGFQPKTALQEGLKLTIEWFKNNSRN